jgi:hypothetical protein
VQRIPTAVDLDFLDPVTENLGRKNNAKILQRYSRADRNVWQLIFGTEGQGLDRNTASRDDISRSLKNFNKIYRIRNLSIRILNILKARKNIKKTQR